MGMWLDRHSIDLERIAVSELLTFDQVESKLFGFNHADVGAALAKAWNLPGVLVDAIGHHHPRPDSDSEAVPDTFSDVIRVADAIAYRQGLDMGILGYPRPFDGDSVERLNLTGDQIEDIGSEFASRFEEHQRLFERSTAAA
ncbi:MAG: HDOD domain-containing protein [Fimbriimonadaceae bacterium]|nr:HDOD domain-containing protein [Fimbriimonadaceae bacterium]